MYTGCASVFDLHNCILLILVWIQSFLLGAWMKSMMPWLNALFRLQQQQQIPILSEFWLHLKTMLCDLDVSVPMYRWMHLLSALSRTLFCRIYFHGKFSSISNFIFLVSSLQFLFLHRVLQKKTTKISYWWLVVLIFPLAFLIEGGHSSFQGIHGIAIKDLSNEKKHTGSVSICLWMSIWNKIEQFECYLCLRMSLEIKFVHPLYWHTGIKSWLQHWVVNVLTNFQFYAKISSSTPNHCSHVPGLFGLWTWGINNYSGIIKHG